MMMNKLDVIRGSFEINRKRARDSRRCNMKRK